MNTPAIIPQWNIIERPDGTLWIQGEPDANGWREVCSLPIFPSRNRDKVAANAKLLCAAPELMAGLRDAISGLEVARKALETAQACMAAHELQDSKYDNARDLVFTAKVAAHATQTRARAAIAKATGETA